MITINGRAYLARTSKQVPASLEIDAGTVTLRTTDGEAIHTFPQDDLKFEAPLGRSDRRATLPDGTLFESPDHAAVEDLTGKTAGDVLHVAERFNRRLIYVAIGALIGAAAIWRFALPALVYVAVLLTPEPLKNAMDAGTLQAFDRTVANPSKLTSERQDEVRTVFANLTRELDHPDETQFDLHFRSVPGIGPNAVALPGGTVVITDALVESFPGDDVVAAVLGHELGHVVEDHGLTQLYRSLGFFILVSLIAGDTGPILEDILLEGGVILSLSYSREFERDADAFGLRLTQDAGYDPAALITFFEALPGPVVDSFDIRRDPEGILRKLCEAIDLDFDPAMLSWPVGPKAFDGVWAPHWYGSVHRSTGFAGAEGRLPVLEGSMADLTEMALPYYERLKATAI